VGLLPLTATRGDGGRTISAGTRATILAILVGSPSADPRDRAPPPPPVLGVRDVALSTYGDQFSSTREPREAVAAIVDICGAFVPTSW